MANKMLAEIKCAFPVMAPENITLMILCAPYPFCGKLGSHMFKLRSHKREGGWVLVEEPVQEDHPLWTLYEQKINFCHVKSLIFWGLSVTTTNLP